MSDLVAHQITNSIGDLLATAVGDRDSEDQGVIVGGGEASAAKASSEGVSPDRGQGVDADHDLDRSPEQIDRDLDLSFPTASKRVGVNALMAPERSTADQQLLADCELRDDRLVHIGEHDKAVNFGRLTLAGCFKRPAG
jgi:hypothetical protein